MSFVNVKLAKYGDDGISLNIYATSYERTVCDDYVCFTKEEVEDFKKVMKILLRLKTSVAI